MKPFPRAICAFLAVLALAAAPASAASFADFLQNNPLYSFISEGVPGGRMRRALAQRCSAREQYFQQHRTGQKREQADANVLHNVPLPGAGCHGRRRRRRAFRPGKGAPHMPLRSGTRTWAIHACPMSQLLLQMYWISTQPSPSSCPCSTT